MRRSGAESPAALSRSSISRSRQCLLEAERKISWIRTRRGQQRSPSPQIIAPGDGPFNFIVAEEATPRFATAKGSNTPSDQRDPQFCSHGNQTLPPGHALCRDAKLKRIPSRDDRGRGCVGGADRSLCPFSARFFFLSLIARRARSARFPLQHAGSGTARGPLRAARLRLRVVPSALRVLRGGSHREVRLQRPAEHPDRDPRIHQEPVHNWESDRSNRSGEF